MPRLVDAVGLPQDLPDTEYLDAIKNLATQVLFPSEEAPMMGLHDRGPEGDSLLHLASTWGDVRAVRLLVEAGCAIESKGEMDETPLHNAVSARRLEVVRFLISRGADPNAKDAFGYSPREWAAKMGYSEIFCVLQKR